jgi:hypothetical protein
MERASGGTDDGPASTTYRQARLDAGIGMAVLAVALVLAMVAVFIVGFANGWWEARRGVFPLAFLALSPFLGLLVVHSAGPRGPLRRLFEAAGTVIIDRSGISWTFRGDAGSVNWTQIGGIQIAPRRSNRDAIVRDERGELIVWLPSVLIPEGNTGSRSLVDLVAAARADRYELVPGRIHKACILRAVAEAERSAAASG